MIPTPKVDWLALSPTLALLGASGGRAPRQRARALVGPPRLRGVRRVRRLRHGGRLRRRRLRRTAESRTLIAESFTRDRLGALAAIIVAGAGR